MGLFAFQERLHLWKGVNTLDFVPKPCVKGTAPLGIPAHIACERCGFAAQKTLTKAYPAVCGEGKALLRKCNNPL